MTRKDHTTDGWPLTQGFTADSHHRDLVAQANEHAAVWRAHNSPRASRATGLFLVIMVAFVTGCVALWVLA